MLSLKDVCLLHNGIMAAVKLEVLVLMVLILEVEAVFLMFLAKMAKCGIKIRLIVYVLKELNGMETSA